MNYLIIGASSVAGQAAIDAIKEKDSEAIIYGTTSQKKAELAQVDHTVFNIDLSEKGFVQKTVQGLPPSLNVEVLFFTPAFGPIGFAVSESTPAQVKEANAFCLDPMVSLVEELSPHLAVSYSAFYWLPHLLGFYGALAYTKRNQEKLAIENPGQYRVIRAGSFFSKATRGISLLMQRQLKKGGGEELADLRAGFEKSGKKFTDYFFDYIYQSEEKAFQGRFDEPYRPTDPRDLARATAEILSGDKSPIISVLGNYMWKDNSLPADMPDFLKTGP